MPKYVVTYVWEETCYVEAETREKAEAIGDSIEMKSDGLDLREGKTRVRKATREEQEDFTFEGAEDEED